MSGRPAAPGQTRGVCRGCGVDFALTGEGKIRRHSVDGPGTQECSGSRGWPMPAADVVRPVEQLVAGPRGHGLARRR